MKNVVKVIEFQIKTHTERHIKILNGKRRLPEKGKITKTTTTNEK